MENHILEGEHMLSFQIPVQSLVWTMILAACFKIVLSFYYHCSKENPILIDDGWVIPHWHQNFVFVSL